MAGPAEHDRAVVENASRRRQRGLLLTALLAATAASPAHPAPACDDAAIAAAATVEQLVRAAECQQAAGASARALEALDRALRAAGPGDAAAIGIHARAAELNAALGDHARAIVHFADGIAVAADTGRPGEAAALLNDLGRAYMAVDEPLRGLAAFADSQRLAASAELRATAGINLLRARGETTDGGDWTAALEDADAEVARLPDSTAKAAILLGFAELARELAPRTTAPGRALERSLAAARRALALAPTDSALAADAHGQLGASYAALGELDRGLAATRRAVLIAQAAENDAAAYRWEWQTARLLRARGDERGAVSAYRAAVATLGRAEGRLVTSRRAFRRDVSPLYEEYADLTLANARRQPDAGAALREVQQTLEQLRIAEVRNYFEDQCTVPETFAARGPDDERTAVLYPMLFADRAELLVDAGGRLQQFTADVELARLVAETNLLRESIQDPARGDDYLAPARRLYDWLLAPLEETLRATDAERLVIVPDGPLRTIPFAVLHDGERFLVERYAIATTPGVSLLGAAGAAPASRALLGGLSAPVRGFPGLPFVADELRNVATTLPSRIYADDAFVTATLEREILAGGYSIVHMATHARFDADYRRSFLLAYDDVITLDRLEAIIGSQRGAERPVELLVLSACETAVGDERAALGLAGVAVKAGVRSALASLWFVNDESTARLVAEFYRQLIQPDNDKADALRGAQLLLMNDAEHGHPAFWAPFLLIGDWR